MSTQSKHYLWAAMAICSIPLSGLSIDIYVPSLPAVANYFNVDKFLVQLSISLYVLGFGVGQLFAGSITDTLGRKKPFVIAMVIYLLTSLLIPLSGNIYLLLTLRISQGLAMAFVSVPMRAVLSDLFVGKEFYKMMNYMTLCWSIGPIIAPAIGGYLQHYFGWQAPFYFLFGYALIAFILVLLILPETLPEKRSLNLNQIKQTFVMMMTHLDYVAGIVCLGVLWSLAILFSIVAPFLVQNVLHYSAIEFGHMALLMGLAWFLGNLTNRLLININFHVKVKFCLWLMLINTVIMVLFAFWHAINLPNLLTQTFILIYFGGLVFPNFFARNISWFPKNAATANALSGAFMTMFASLSSSAGALLKSNTQLPLAGVYLLLVVICLTVYMLISRKVSANSI